MPGDERGATSGNLPAGDFAPWLAQIRRATAGEGDSEVPCGECAGCCSSSQFIHIGPDERDTLAHIPAALLFPAPRLPRGNVLMGYDEHGCCPMLIDGACSVYHHRPRTCRTYDCRIFTAAGLEVDDESKAPIAARVARWQFSHPTAIDGTLPDAVLAAASSLEQHASSLPDGAVPAGATQRAALAIDVHEAFVDHDPTTGAIALTTPDADAVRVAILRRHRAP